VSSDRILALSSIDVDNLLSLQLAVDAVTSAFQAHANGEARLFPFVRERLEAGSVCGIKSGYWPGRNLVGLKLAGYWSGNSSRSLSNHQASVMLVEATSGRLLAVLDGNLITSRRTAAAAVVATRVLARSRPRVVAILGCGVQGREQARAMLASFENLAELRLWDRSPDRAERLAGTLRGSTHTRSVLIAGSAGAAAHGADVIVTTTASTSPILSREEIAPGTHVNAMGSDTSGKRELDPRLFEDALLVVDDREQSRLLGESQPPVIWRQDPPTIGEVLLGRQSGRGSDDQITVFDSTGIGLQDVAAADVAYREAVRQGRGTPVPWPAI
jgi:ornithine cyclodeaminase/alanine dehydrogenase-like protein (mu-crystallin family)